MTNPAYTFSPDWCSAPGDTITDLLEERRWSQLDLAKTMGFTAKQVNLLINGKAPITEEIARELERVLGGTTSFWLTRETQYRKMCNCLGIDVSHIHGEESSELIVSPQRSRR